MALQVLVHKETGAIDSPTLPVIVYDDGTPPAYVSATAAIAAANAAFGTVIPSTFFGYDSDGNPGMRRLSKSAFEFVVNYRPDSTKPSKPPQVGEERSGFNWHAPRKWVQFAPEIARFPGGAGPSQNIVNMVLDEKGSVTSSGAWIDPPVANLTKSFSVAPGTVTGSWVRSIASLMGHVNSVSLTSGAYAVGEICLVHVIGSLISEQAFHLDFGWNWTQNVSSETRGDVTGVSYNGQDYVWDALVPYTDRDGARIAWKIATTYVHRVRKYSDLSGMGVVPP